MDAKKLAISLALPLLAGAAGSLFTMPAIPVWYASLVKPWFTPPSWLFAPAWTLLYVLMGASFYLVWKHGFRGHRALALCTYSLQLVLNVIWSFLFFYVKMPPYAFIEIILLWFSIIATMIAFHRISKSAAYLLVPYLLWVSFAAILNFAVVVLNP